MPERPPETTEVTVRDLLDAVPGLRLADRDWRALAGMRHPVKVALWLALMRPSEELARRESLEEWVRSSRENREQRTEMPTTQDPVTANSERQNRENVPELRSIPAVIAWAEAAVRKGIRGDMAAWSLVADRIEGRVGHRKDDVDPEDERRRGDIQSVIESVVAGLVNARLEQPGDDSLDVTPEIPGEHILDNERQDSDTARRREIVEIARRETQDNQARGESLAQTNDPPEERDLTNPRQTNGHGS